MPARLGADMKAVSDLGGRIGRARLASGMGRLGVRRQGVLDSDLAMGVMVPDLGVRMPMDFAARVADCFLMGGEACSRVIGL